VRLTLFLPLLLMPLVAACGGDSPAEDDGRLASGEVLEGTISDAMLPLATTRSQPPLLAPEPAANGSRPVASTANSPEAAEEDGGGEAEAELSAGTEAGAEPAEAAE
jgi:hypothetical protein